MYDAGVRVAHSPSLAGRAPCAVAGLEPADRGRHGLAEGEVVDLIADRGTVQVAVTADPGVARGTGHLRGGQADVDAGRLIDASAAAPSRARTSRVAGGGWPSATSRGPWRSSTRGTASSVAEC